MRFKSFLFEKMQADKSKINDYFIFDKKALKPVEKIKIESFGINIGQSYRFKGTNNTIENIKIQKEYQLFPGDDFIVLEKDGRYIKIKGDMKRLQTVITHKPIKQQGKYAVREIGVLCALDFGVHGGQMQNYSQEMYIQDIKKRRPGLEQWANQLMWEDAIRTATAALQIGFSDGAPDFVHENNKDFEMRTLKNKINGDFAGWNPGDIWGFTKNGSKALKSTEFQELKTEMEVSQWLGKMMENKSIIPISLKKTVKKANLAFIDPGKINLEDVENQKMTKYTNTIKSGYLYSNLVFIHMDNPTGFNGNIQVKPKLVDKSFGKARSDGSLVRKEGSPLDVLIGKHKHPVYQRGRAQGNLQNTPNPVSKSLFNKYKTLLGKSRCEQRPMNITDGANTRDAAMTTYFDMSVMTKEKFTMNDLVFEDMSERGLFNYVNMASWIVFADDMFHELTKLAFYQGAGGMFKSAHWKIN